MSKVELTASIVMATYNGEKYLSEQLASLQTQTRLPSELIISDDCSKDSTRKILEGAARISRFPVKILLQEKNLGFVGNFSAAIVRAMGDIIFLCDQDDRWKEGKIEAFLQRFENDPNLDAFFCNARMMDENGADLASDFFSLNHFTIKEQNAFHQQQGWKISLKRNVVAGNMLAFRKKWMEKILPIPAGYVHDAWIVAFLTSVGRVDCTAEELSFYRSHTQQSIGTLDGSFSEKMQHRLQRARGTSLQELERERLKIEKLLERAQQHDAAADCLTGWKEKRKFLSTRSRMSSLLIARIPTILTNFAQYQRYDNGFSSMVKDFLAPSSKSK